jgi:hypothetical protein
MRELVDGDLSNERSTSRLNINESTLDQSRKSLTNHGSAHTVLIGELSLGGKLLPRGKLARKNSKFQ